MWRKPAKWSVSVSLAAQLLSTRRRWYSTWCSDPSRWIRVLCLAKCERARAHCNRVTLVTYTSTTTVICLHWLNWQVEWEMRGQRIERGKRKGRNCKRGIAGEEFARVWGEGTRGEAASKDKTREGGETEEREREREKRAEGVEVGFKGSPDTAGSCIKLKLANQTRYRRNLIVILIKIATDEDSLKCELRLKRTPRESLDLSNDEGARSS